MDNSTIRTFVRKQIMADRREANWPGEADWCEPSANETASTQPHRYDQRVVGVGDVRGSSTSRRPRRRRSRAMRFRRSTSRWISGRKMSRRLRSRRPRRPCRNRNRRWRSSSCRSSRNSNSKSSRSRRLPTWGVSSMFNGFRQMFFLQKQAEQQPAETTDHRAADRRGRAANEVTR